MEMSDTDPWNSVTPSGVAVVIENVHVPSPVGALAKYSEPLND
jgi:hypothetical protein